DRRDSDLDLALPGVRGRLCAGAGGGLADIDGGNRMTRKVPRIEMMDDATAEVLSRKTPAERLAIGHGLWRSASDNLRSVLAQLNPGWTQEQIDREVAVRMSHGAVRTPSIDSTSRDGLRSSVSPRFGTRCRNKSP